MENEENADVITAIAPLKAYGQTLEEFKRAIRDMLDNVMVAGQSGLEQDVLRSWNEGQAAVDYFRALCLESADAASEFMEETSFGGLDGGKKSDYWNMMETIGKTFAKIDAQYALYRLLATLDHTDQTIRFLWDRSRQQSDTFLCRQANGDLVNRGLHLHRCRRHMTRDNIRCEIHIILKQLEAAIEHQSFSTLHREKQQECHKKWKNYRKMLLDIDVD